MTASKQLINLIEISESFRSNPYLCPAGIPTIGFGSTRYHDGTPVTLHDLPITRDRAEEIMLSNLGEYEAAVNRYVAVPLNQNQFDALVDFAYNAGCQNFRGSTLLKKLNTGDYSGAADEFKKWVYGHDPKTKQAIRLRGLVIRREAERNLFIGE
jgi:lysozyme